MARTTWTVDTLARASGLDPEQVLVSLWGEGIEYADDFSSRIRPEDSRRAEAVTGIVGSRLRRVAFWEEELGLSRSELALLLDELGYVLHRNASNLPKGAIRRLERYRDVNGMAAPLTAPTLPQSPPFVWSCVGVARECLCLLVEEVISIHAELEQDFLEADDPISPPGIRYMDLLESAVDRQHSGFGQDRKYSTPQATGAALLHSLVHNHPFHNGNKRTALVSMLVFLDRNGLVLESTQDDLFRWMVQVAAHDLLPKGFVYDQQADRETYAISEWINRHSRPIRREERTVTWRTLQRILRNYGCDIRQLRGEKLAITRVVTVKSRGFFGTRKQATLSSHFVKTGDGREVPRSQIRRIRDDLQLNDEHGIDSQQFYGQEREPDFFIAEYSKLLRRLARV